MTARTTLAALALALAACLDPRTPAAPADPASPPVEPVAATTPAAAGPAEPPPPPAPTPAATLLRAAAALEPAGPVPLSADGETVVDPATSFDVELGAPLTDVRLVLLDGRDAHVPATAARELGTTTRLTLSPAAPLVPGSRYVLRLEGASSRELRDADGRPFTPLSFPLLAAGSPPPPEPKKPARRRRR